MNGIVINDNNDTIDCDIISGNGMNGVLINGNGNTIQGNTIGLDDTGADAGNNNNGIEVDSVSGGSSRTTSSHQITVTASRLFDVDRRQRSPATSLAWMQTGSSRDSQHDLRASS